MEPIFHVGAGGSRTVTVSPGNYTVSAVAGTARKVDNFSMDAGHEETITYSVTRYYQ